MSTRAAQPVIPPIAAAPAAVPARGAAAPERIS